MTSIDAVLDDPHLAELLAARAAGAICASSPEEDRRALDRLLLGELGAAFVAHRRDREARALCMPCPSDEPFLVLFTNHPEAALNGVYEVGDSGELVRARPPEMPEAPAPWWRGAVAAVGGGA